MFIAKLFYWWHMQIGDMFGDLAGLRATLAGMQASSSPSALAFTKEASGRSSPHSGQDGDVSASAAAVAAAAAPAVDAEAMARLVAMGKDLQVRQGCSS
jgi:hypothetical protein